MELKIYKSGQGYYTRLMTALLSFAVVAIGCYILWGKLQGANPWVSSLVPLGICAAFGLLIYWIVNKPNVADFMIAAEGEIKKVSWSSRKEIISSTIIVIGVVLFVGIMLAVTDLLFIFLFSTVLKIS